MNGPSSTKGSIDLEQLGADLATRLGGTWKAGGAMVRCPAHGDRNPSLSIRVGDHALLFKCFAGCDARDVIRAIRRVDARAVQSLAIDGSPARAGKGEFWSRQRALNLWDQARPLAGTPGEIYLRRRSIAMLSPALRFHPRTPHGGGEDVTFRPAMIAALHEAGRFVAVQRTFFDWNEPRRARDLDNARLMLGRPRHGAVMLGPATDCLGLAEGVETAMSAMILFRMPVWATLGTERFHQIVLPSGISRLTLFPDNDAAGEIAVAAALHAYACVGLPIETVWPPDGHCDWNDVLRSRGKRVVDRWRC